MQNNNILNKIYFELPIIREDRAVVVGASTQNTKALAKKLVGAFCMQYPYLISYSSLTQSIRKAAQLGLLGLNVFSVTIPFNMPCVFKVKNRTAIRPDWKQSLYDGLII